MLEVKRYWVHWNDQLYVADKDGDLVMAEDFDRVAVERDALQQRLTAADERVDVLEGLLSQTNELLYAIQDELGALTASAVDVMRGKVFTALKPADGPAPTTCTWSANEFLWGSTCGMTDWEFTDGGTPGENGMKFCHCCGKTLVVEPAEGGGDEAVNEG